MTQETLGTLVAFAVIVFIAVMAIHAAFRK